MSEVLTLLVLLFSAIAMVVLTIGIVLWIKNNKPIDLKKIKKSGIELITTIVSFLTTLTTTLCGVGMATINNNINIRNDDTINIQVTQNGNSQSDEEIFKQIISAVDAEDYKTVSEYLSKDSVKYNATLLSFQGYMYANGLYYGKDINKAAELFDASYKFGYDAALILKLKLYLDNFMYEEVAFTIEEGIKNRNDGVVNYIEKFCYTEEFLSLSTEERIEFIFNEIYKYTFIDVKTYDSMQYSTTQYKMVRVSSSINTNHDGSIKNTYTYQKYEYMYQYKDLLEIDILSNLKY